MAAHPLLTSLALAILLALGSACTDESGPAGSAAPTPSTPPTGPVGGGPIDDPTVDAVAGVLLMWGRGGLAEDVPALVEDVVGVTQVRVMRTDTLGLIGSLDGHGHPFDDLADGFQIPVNVTAIDPAEWAEALAATGDEPGPLIAGTAMLSATFHARMAEPDGPTYQTVSLVGLEDLEVVGVLPDGTVGSADIVIHEDDAPAAGIQRGPSLVIEHETETGPRRAELVAALESLGDRDHPVRVVDTDDPTVRHDAPLVLSLRDVKSIFGEFAYRPRSGTRDVTMDQGWIDAHIVIREVPLLGNVRCHRGIMDDLSSALKEIELAGLGPAIRPEQYAGCFHPRRISTDGASLSHHAWGIAIDINVDLGLPGGGEPPDPQVIAIFGKHGFRWGGDFIVPDNHHFEWVGGLVERI